MDETVAKVAAPVNGYKSYIGATILALGQVSTMLGRPDIGGALEVLGQLVLTIGISHKFAKATAP